MSESLQKLAYLKNIFETIQKPLLIVDKMAKIQFVNNSFSNLCGYNNTEILAKHISFLLPKKQNPELISAFEAYLSEGANLSVKSIILDKQKNRWETKISVSSIEIEAQTVYLFQFNECNVINPSDIQCLDKEDMFNALSKASVDIIDLPDLESIYKYICINLQKLYPNTIVLFVSIDEARKNTQLIEIAGIKSKILDLANKITGYEPKGAKYKLVPDIINHFKTGNLTKFENGLADFSMQQFPRVAADSIQKLLGIHKIYTIGINKGDELLGAVHFFTKNKEELKETKFIELFVRQAASVIQNRIMQDQVYESERKFRSIFEEAPMGIALIDSLNGQIYEVNKKFAEIAGYSMDEIIKTDWMEITHPDDIQPDLDNMAKLNSGEIDGFNMDKRYIKKDGSIVWINMTITPVFGQNLKSPCHLAIIEDITERKRNLQKIESDKILLRTLVDNIPDSIYVKNDEARKILSNLADISICGYQTEDEILGKTDLELFANEDGMHGYEEDLVVLKNGTPIINDENFFINSKGEKQWIQTSKIPLYNNIQQIVGLVGIGKNITKRKIAEEELKANFQFIQSLIESIPMGMNVVDSQGVILFQNDKINKEATQQLIGKKCWEVNCDNNQRCHKCPLRNGIELGVTKTFETSGLFRGKTIEISYTGIIFEKQLAMLEIYHDITPIRNSEQKLKIYSEELQKSNAAKDKLFSVVSHDLKNPFNSILGLASLLADNINSFTKEELTEISKTLFTESNSAFILLNNLLNWSRTQLQRIVAKPIIFEINTIVNQTIKTVEVFSKKKNIEINWDNSQPIYAFADPDMIETVFRNIVYNAIKFTPNDGNISIHIEEIENKIQFAIKDNGIGIPDQTLKALFSNDKYASTFGTNNETGTGLGLQICKEFVQLNKGEIWVESTIQKGSTFYFSIPKTTKF